MIVKLYCPHGFAYAGYQRIIVTSCDRDDGNDFVLNAGLAKQIAEELVDSNNDPDLEFVIQVDHNLFVLSGESFSLADFAEVVNMALRRFSQVTICTVMFKDEDGGWITC